MKADDSGGGSGSRAMAELPAHVQFYSCGRGRTAGSGTAAGYRVLARRAGVAGRRAFARRVLRPAGRGRAAGVRVGAGVRVSRSSPPPPPVIVVPPPVVFAGNIDRRDAPAASGVRNAAQPPLREARGDFVVFRPQKGPPPDEGMIVPEGRPRGPAAAGVPVRPVREARPVGKVERPDPDPARGARQIGLARSAFAAEEYGRAAERLAAAIKAPAGRGPAAFPDRPGPDRRGEYAEAVAAIRDGMKLDPDWPAAAFRPKDFYGARPDRFDAHLAELRAAVATQPADPAAGFLLGYHLWFTGRQDEAVKLFRRVTKQVKDNAIVERFLREVDAKVAGR